MGSRKVTTLGTKKPKQRRRFHHLIDTPLVSVLCLGCSKPMLEGMCYGVRVVLTPTPLDATVETWCRDSGVMTYDVMRWGMQRFARPRLDTAQCDFPILASHHCGGSDTLPRTRPVPKTPYDAPTDEKGFPF